MARETAPWRHSSQCSICRSAQQREIELEFLRWQSPAAIARQFGLGSRLAVWRHCRATGLFEKRATDARGILVSVIERGLDVSRLKIPASTIVAAATALSKLDSDGRTVERFQQVDRDAAFLNDPRWTLGEMETFAATGKLPMWADELVERSTSASRGSNRPN
jgi:hypothetical protein